MSLIFPDDAIPVSTPAGTEKIMAARASDGKIIFFTAAQLFAALGGGGEMTGAEIRTALGITTLSGINTGDQDLSNLVVKDGLKVLSDENYTSTEKSKLANLNNYYVGTYASYGALVAAHPTGLAGQYAVVDTNVTNARTYIWDETNSDWVQGNTGQVTSVNGQVGAVSLDTDDIGEGATNKYWTLARTVGALLTGYVAGTTHVAVAATDTIMQAIQKLSGSVVDIYTALTSKQDKSGFIDMETPAGDIDGLNTDFIIDFAPVSGSLHLYLNGLLQEIGSGNDYTLSGSTITMLTAPLTGAKLKASYRK